MKQKPDSNTKQGHSTNMLLYAVAPQPKLSTDGTALDGVSDLRGSGIGATSKPFRVPVCNDCLHKKSEVLSFKDGLWHLFEFNGTFKIRTTSPSHARVCNYCGAKTTIVHERIG